MLDTALTFNAWLLESEDHDHPTLTFDLVPFKDFSNDLNHDIIVDTQCICHFRCSFFADPSERLSFYSHICHVTDMYHSARTSV